MQAPKTKEYNFGLYAIWVETVSSEVKVITRENGSGGDPFYLFVMNGFSIGGSCCQVQVWTEALANAMRDWFW